MRKLSPRDSRPLYAQIMQIIEQEIAAGRLEPGDQLPTQEALATHFAVSLAPVKQALRELEERGIVSTRQGRGTYVVDAAPLSAEIIDANRIPNFTRDMLESGRKPGSNVLEVGTIEASEAPFAAEYLKATPEQRLVRVSRLRLADETPLCLQTGYFLEERVPGLVERGLRGDESLTEVLQAEYGLAIAVSKQTITATAATREDADHLKVDLGAPLLLVERISFLNNNEPVEFLTDRRLPDFSFVVWLRRG